MSFWEILGFALAKAKGVWLGRQALGTLASLLAILALAPRLRKQGRRDWSGYLSKGFRTDVAYTVFYVGGFHAFLVSGPVYRLLRNLVATYSPALQMDLLGGLPLPAQFALGSVLMDGVAYWAHRWAHASPVLWAFHGVHHSQRELTPLTNFRFHFVDVLVRSLAQFVPALVLGVPSEVWIPLIWVQTSLDALAHADLDWSYGKLEAVLVSPRFHRMHHSIEPDRSNANFGFSYSFWDRLFRTAAPGFERPAAYGTTGLDVPESFVRQLAFPFVRLLRGRRAGCAP